MSRFRKASSMALDCELVRYKTANSPFWSCWFIFNSNIEPATYRPSSASVGLRCILILLPSSFEVQTTFSNWFLFLAMIELAALTIFLVERAGAFADRTAITAHPSQVQWCRLSTRFLRDTMSAQTEKRWLTVHTHYTVPIRGVRLAARKTMCLKRSLTFLSFFAVAGVPAQNGTQTGTSIKPLYDSIH